MKEDQMGGACGTNGGEKRKTCIISVGKLEGNRQKE